VCRERPRRCRTAEQRDELASDHHIDHLLGAREPGAPRASGSPLNAGVPPGLA